VIVNKEHGYAGTVDLVLRVDGEVWLIDLKTSKSIYPSHEVQLSSYFHGTFVNDAVELKFDKQFILQLGYPHNKNKYKFTEIEDKFDLFLSCKNIWANEVKQKQPMQKDYPLSIALPSRSTQEKELKEVLPKKKPSPKKKVTKKAKK
jgi:hypothetical protein